MSIPGSASPLFFTAAAEAAAAGPIKSVRFNSADSAYLNRTPSSAGNRKTWTWSAWVKRSEIGSRQYLFTAGIGSGSTESTYFRIAFESDDKFWVGTYNYNVRYTDMLFRDTSAWYHIVVKFDSTAATEADRCIIYVNGVEQSTTGSGLVQDADYAINSTEPHHFSYNSYYLDCYLADVYLIDGQALDSTSFGAFDDNGVWQAAAYSGTFGTNGFHLFDFANESGIGDDSSGNDNDFTVNNISSTAGVGNDVLFDVPTNGDSSDDSGAGGQVSGNYPTLNPIDKRSTVTLENGNLEAKNASYHAARATMQFPATGKWYLECQIGALNDMVGLVGPNFNIHSQIYNGTQAYHFQVFNTSTSYKYNPSGVSPAYVSYSGTYTSSSIIQIAVDCDAKKAWFGVDNTYVNSGDPAAGSGEIFSSLPIDEGMAVVSGSSSSSSAQVFNFGQRPFAYTAPSGYKALCTTNLPTPTIADGSDYFDVTTYDGTQVTRSITGLEFGPDLVWTKSRSNSNNHEMYDSVRGAQKLLYPNRSDQEVTTTNGISSFNSDGWTMGNRAALNYSGRTYVAWAWDAGTSTVSNTDGSITSQVRANQTAGFSIVSYSGNNTTGATVGHGLNAKPGFIIVKSRTAQSANGNWNLWHKNLANNQYLTFTTGTTLTGAWANIAPTNSVFSLTNFQIQNATGDYIAYCFAPVAGYSAFGSYEGNGSTDGPFIYTGFRPKWVMYKSIDTAKNWQIQDTERDSDNPVLQRLSADLSDAEYTGTSTSDTFDALSNGFKIRGSNNGINQSSTTYIYAAFAENPFQANGGLAR